MKSSSFLLIFSALLLTVACTGRRSSDTFCSQEQTVLSSEITTDSILFKRTWKNPKIYILDKPSDAVIRKWQSICEQINPEMNEMKIPSFKAGYFIDREITFYDLAAVGFNSDKEDIIGDNAFMLWRINEFMPAAEEPKNETERYEILCAQMDSLLNCLGSGTQWDYNINSDLRAVFAHIRVQEYANRLEESFPAMSESLKEEYLAWESYYETSSATYHIIRLGPGCCGSAFPMAICGFLEESSLLMIEAMMPFYFHITDPSYVYEKSTLKPVTDRDIFLEYDRFSVSLEREMHERYDPELDNPIEDQLAALERDREQWAAWLSSRQAVSEALTPDHREIYDDCTNRLRRRKLIDLKNRYEDYGIQESSLKLYLQYDCSDKELSEHDFEALLDKELSN